MFQAILPLPSGNINLTHKKAIQQSKCPSKDEWIFFYITRPCNRIVFGHKNEGSIATCYDMYEPCKQDK